MRSIRQLRPSGMIPILLIALAWMLVLVGCDSAGRAYDKGQDYLQQGRYDDAVAQFEDALSRCREEGDSSCVEYEAMVTQARLRAAEHHLARARHAYQEADLASAREHLDRADRYHPGNSAHESLRAAIDRGGRRAGELHDQAIALAAENDFDGALDALARAIEQDSSRASAREQQKRIRRRAHDYYLGRAQAALNGGDFDAAAAQARQAGEYLPGSSEANSLVRTIEDHRQADALVRQARPLLEDDPARALDLLTRAQGLHPNRSDLAGLLHQTRQNLADRYFADASEALDDERPHDALAHYRRAQELLPHYRSPDVAIRNVLRHLASRHNTTADNYLATGQPANALLYSLLALHYRPEDPEAMARVAEARGTIDDRLRLHLAYVGFAADRRHRELARRLSNALLAHLDETAPHYVALIDRGDLLDDLPLDPENLDDQVRLAQVLFHGRIESAVIREARATSHAITTFRSGAELRPNPEHIQALAAIETARARVHTTQAAVEQVQAEIDELHEQTMTETDPAARQRLARAGRQARQRLDRAVTARDQAGADFDAARERLRQIPPQVAIPVLTEFEYPIHDVTHTAILNVSGRAIDPRDHSVLFAEEMTAEAPAADRYVPGDPLHNVPGDPLELPADAALLDQAVDVLVPVLAQRLEPMLAGPADQLLEDYERARDAGKAEQAREAAIAWIFACPNPGAKATKLITYVRSTLDTEEADMPLENLLRQHGKVLQNP